MIRDEHQRQLEKAGFRVDRDHALMISGQPVDQIGCLQCGRTWLAQRAAEVTEQHVLGLLGHTLVCDKAK